MTLNLNTNRFFSIVLKALRNSRYAWNRLKLSLEIQELGRNCKVLDSVLISGGKNIQIGRNCFIGRNVILDARQGPITIGDGTEIRDNARLYSIRISIGDSVTLGENAMLKGQISVAAGSWISRGSDLEGRVTVEKSILGPRVVCVGGGDHPRDPKTGQILMTSSPEQKSELNKNSEIKISEGAWLGSGAIILKGVVIGKNAIVGAGAVVTKTFPDHSVLVGVPAQPLFKETSRK